MLAEEEHRGLSSSHLFWTRLMPRPASSPWSFGDKLQQAQVAAIVWAPIARICRLKLGVPVDGGYVDAVCRPLRALS
jgi:hypothetical protein